MDHGESLKQCAYRLGHRDQFLGFNGFYQIESAEFDSFLTLMCLRLVCLGLNCKILNGSNRLRYFFSLNTELHFSKVALRS